MGTGTVQDVAPAVNWTLWYQGKPWTLNEERGRGGKKGGGSSGHWSSYAGMKAQWRGDFKLLALEAKIPPCQWIKVNVHQFCDSERMPDPGNIFPAIKAAIDGLVDARVIPKDTRKYVHFIGFWAPLRGERSEVALRIEGDPVV
jgi:crossover junction endodeoxyribonuclease RusA